MNPDVPSHSVPNFPFRPGFPFRLGHSCSPIGSTFGYGSGWGKELCGNIPGLWWCPQWGDRKRHSPASVPRSGVPEPIAMTHQDNDGYCGYIMTILRGTLHKKHSTHSAVLMKVDTRTLLCFVCFWFTPSGAWGLLQVLHSRDHS